jgi:hypothetical protein
MNHAITIGGLLLGLGAVGGVLAACLGGLMVMAAGMSDAGDDGTGGAGCAVLIAGAIIAALCIAGLVL